MTETSLVKGPIEKVIQIELATATKSGKTPGSLKYAHEITSASGEVRINVMVELCQQVFDGKAMPDE